MSSEALTIFWLITIFFIIEIIVGSLVFFVKRKFPWLITASDEHPKLSKEGLLKFIPHGYDSELGWVRKPNTSHSEVGKSKTTNWNINSKGSRKNLGLEDNDTKISCYGDSFVFCRQVNDDETWEHYLSKGLKTNVLNFGVGNYGIDQALLRLKKEYPKNRTEIVILGVVPDTICRILSIWKHYYEYGNTFGFKPRFILQNEKLVHIKNPIDDESKFNDYEKYLEQIQQNDFFYKEKFKKEIIHFPYCLTVLKNIKRNSNIIFWVIWIQILKKFGKDTTEIDWNPMRTIMRINLKWRVKLYKFNKSRILLKKIIEDFVSYSKQNEFKPVFVFLPQKDDLLFIKNHYHFYENFIKDLEKITELKIIDVAKDFLKKPNLNELYSDNNEYGGHYSMEGNEEIASIIYRELNFN